MPRWRGRCRRRRLVGASLRKGVFIRREGCRVDGVGTPLPAFALEAKESALCRRFALAQNYALNFNDAARPGTTVKRRRPPAVSIDAGHVRANR